MKRVVNGDYWRRGHKVNDDVLHIGVILNNLDYRRGLILTVLALRSEDLFLELVNRENLAHLPDDLRRRAIDEIGTVDAQFGFSSAETGSEPNYLAFCLEGAIDYLNMNMT